MVKLEWINFKKGKRRREPYQCRQFDETARSAKRTSVALWLESDEGAAFREYEGLACLPSVGQEPGNQPHGTRRISQVQLVACTAEHWRHEGVIEASYELEIINGAFSSRLA